TTPSFAKRGNQFPTRAGNSESTSRQSPTSSLVRGRHTRCTEDARTAEFRARNRFPISVSIGHDAVMTHPAEISAASIASQPDVSLFANTNTDTPDGFVMRQLSPQARVIIVSNHAASLFLYMAAR